jgi:NAD dependent epimerase/dehydratase
MTSVPRNLAGCDVLVTGAGGFIGSHLVERLVTDGARVRALVHYNSRNDWGMLELVPDDIRQEVEVLSGDICDPFCVRNAVAGRKFVFHLAALIPIPYSYVAPQSFVSTNVLGTVNVMQACREEGVERIVHTSTSEVYGSAQSVPIDESHPLRAQSPYAASKVGADMVAESYWRSFELPVGIIRPFNTYGPRQSARAVIPTIISQALVGRVVKLGETLVTRDLNYVDDTVDGFIRMATNGDAVGQVFNVGSGRETSIGDLARMILALLDSSADVELDAQRLRPPRSEVERLVCNNDKAKAVLSWEPRTSLEGGLERTIEWMKNNAARYKAQLYNI